MKNYNDGGSCRAPLKLCLNSLVIILVVVSANYFSVVSSSQIIGSSVVTSVSIVHGDDKKNVPTTLPPSRPTTTTSVPSSSSTPVTPATPSTTTLRPRPPMTTRPDTKTGDEEGVLSVIATLKSIVEKEQKKHIENRSSTSATTQRVQSTDESPPTPKSAKSDINESEEEEEEEDDEADDDVAETGKRPKPVNQSATSVEVHAAIHRISGALLKPGKKTTKPIENILTDVLTSINGARNGTSGISTTIVPETSKKNSPRQPKPTSTTAKPKKGQSGSGSKPASANTSRPAQPSKSASSNKSKPKPTSAPTKVASSSTTTKKTTVTTTAATKTKVKTNVTTVAPPTSQTTKVVQSNMSMSKEPQIGNKVHLISGIQVDDNISPEDTVEDMIDRGGDITTLKYTPKPSSPRPPKPQRPHYHYSNSNGRNNATVTNLRPADFYDDEIFGYDPYQTFLHGVYVPIVDLDMGNRDGPDSGSPTTTKTEPEDSASPTRRPLPTFRPSQFNFQSHSHASSTAKPGAAAAAATSFNLPSSQKPVPNLPDHLYRPRPSHLQYQHSAAESVDTETGQVAVKVPHPGDKNAHPDEDFAPDRLSTQPRPTLAATVVKNLTDHHHAAHHGHEHGHGHGHDHHHHDHHHGHGHDHHSHGHGPENPEKRPTFEKAPNGNPGLEATITNLDPEMRTFVDVNNKVALRLFSSLTNPVSKSSTHYNNMVLSPFTIISSLAMLFLGARGTTAAQLDGLLKLDDALTFNPHMMYYNVTQSFLSQSNTAAAIIRLLIADKQKGDVLDFFKTRVQHFYDTRVEEADYKFAGHLAQSIINQMIRAQIQRHSYEMLNYSLPLKGPMSLITAAFFDGQFSGARDTGVHDMHFIHLAALGRRLIQVPAVSLRGPMRAAYDNDLDATAVEIPYTTRDLSLILLMPGRPGEFAIGGVTSLKSRLTLESWTNLMRGFYPRDSFKIVFPRFRHHTSLNLSYTMQRFGLSDMFQPHLAKFKGINGLNDLHLDQNMQHFTEFGTWEKLSDTLSEATLEGNKKFDLIRILRPQVREQYGTSAEPISVSDWIFKSRSPTLSPRYSNWQSYQPFFSYSRVRSSRGGGRQPRSPNRPYYYRQGSPDGLENPEAEEEKVLRFERPFLYVLRHNPTGMIIMTGQYSEPVTEE